MSDQQHVWALILAAGEGSRLRQLTTKPCGTAVPKQFCSLHGEDSLLEDAIRRAGLLLEPPRICTIVAQRHWQWWSEIRSLQRLPADNIIVQPRNRGTAIGILYSLLHILAKDPHAQVVLLPADHYVRDESILQQSLHEALQRLRAATDKAVLLGMQPEEADTELGYVLPGERDPLGGRAVARFIEKPSTALAYDIIEAGGLWNAFIIAAAAQTLIDLFLPRHAALLMEMQVIVSRSIGSSLPAGGWPAIVDLYQRLPELDFSRHLLEGQERSLCVVRVPPCGWSDLGTPHRVGETLRRLRPHEPALEPVTGGAYLSLAVQHAQLQRMGARL